MVAVYGLFTQPRRAEPQRYRSDHFTRGPLTIDRYVIGRRFSWPAAACTLFDVLAWKSRNSNGDARDPILPVVTTLCAREGGTTSAVHLVGSWEFHLAQATGRDEPLPPELLTAI